MNSTNCSHLFEIALDFRRGKLSDEERNAYLEHLEICPECLARFEREQNIQSLLRGVEMDPLTKRRLTVAVTTGNLAKGRARRGPIWYPIPVASASVLVLTAIGLLIFRNSLSTDERAQEQALEVVDLEPTQPGVPEEDLPRTITTGAETREIEVSSGTTLWVDREAQVSVEVLEAKLAKFRLSRGRVVARINEKKPGFRMVVMGRFMEVEAKGTIFSVDVGPDGRETAKVVEGVVEVRLIEDGSRQLLHAGEEITMGRRAGDDGGVSVVDDTSDLVEGRVHGHPQSLSMERLAEQMETALKEGSFDEATRLLEVITKQYPQCEERKSLMAHLARAYRRQKLYDESATMYEKLLLAFPNSDAALRGAVALAQIEQDVLKKPRSALDHFNQYLKAKPNGVLVEAARAGKVRASYDLGNFGAAISAADEYLRLHPHGMSVPEVGETKAAAELKLASSTGN